jgi:hypothetical protein
VSRAPTWTPPDGMVPDVARQWRAFYSHAQRRYGLAPEQYRLLYLAQMGRCWICRKARGIHPDDPRGTGGRRLAVDHNHLTGAVRGLLCSGGDRTCNRIIGWLNADALRRAADYLDRPPARVLLAAEMASDLPMERRVELATAVLWRDGAV